MEKWRERDKNRWRRLRRKIRVGNFYECTAFIKENENKWKFDNDQSILKQKQENKNRTLALAKIQEEDTLKKLKQQSFSDTWDRLSEHERRKFLAEEEKQRRLDLREAKINICKKRDWKKS